jgi:hypothetical protein
MRPPLRKHFLIKLWLKFGALMTGSMLLTIITMAWSEYTKRSFPFHAWSISLVLFALCAAFLLMRNTLVKTQQLEDELVELRKPKLIIVFGAEQPYVETVREFGTDYRKLRLGVKNVSGVSLNNVRFQIESCLPSSKAIILRNDFEAFGKVGSITIGPDHEQIFEFITIDATEKKARVRYNMSNVNGDDAVIDGQDRIITLVASADESAPARSKFRLEPGYNGFLSLRSVEE